MNHREAYDWAKTLKLGLINGADARSEQSSVVA
jgi:hypothetical protein